MSRWISTHDELIPLYTELTGYNPFSSLARVIFEFDDGIPVAAALYDHFNGHAVHSHVWIAEGRRPSRVWWWVIHDYLFNQLHAKMAVVVADSRNPRSLKLAESMGYKLAATIPGYYGNGDALIFNGTEEDARFWQRYRHGAPAPMYKDSERMPA